MKYYLYINDKGYVSGFIRSEKDFNYDGDLPEDIVISTPEGWYKLETGKLLIDAERKEQVISSRAKDVRIEELQKLLADTDYIQDGFINGLLQLKNPLTFVSDLIELITGTMTEYPQVLAQRSEWVAELKTLKK